MKKIRCNLVALALILLAVPGLFVVCGVLYGLYSVTRDTRLTTLDQWQRAENVLVVEYIGQERGLQKLGVLDTLTHTPPPSDIFYTRGANPLSDTNPYAIMTLTFFVDSANEKHYAHQTLKSIEQDENSAPWYAHPWHDPWILDREADGMLVLNDCLDGLTGKPLMNPTLDQIMALAAGAVDREPAIRLTGLFWPAGFISESKTERCETKKFNPDEAD